MERMLNKLSALVGALLLLALPARATTYFVAGTGGATTGNDANACTDWSIPCLTVAGALGKATPTVIAVDKTGAYVQTGAITWTMPATAITIVSATNNTTGTTINQSPGASEGIGNSANPFTINGAQGSMLTVIGMHLSATTGAASNNIAIGTGSTGEYFYFDGCTFELPGTSTSSNIAPSGTSYLKISNSTFLVSGSRAGNIFLLLGGMKMELVNPTITMTGGTKPVTLMSFSVGDMDIVIRDGDISGFNTASSALAALGQFGPTGRLLMKNLKISATPTLTSGSYSAGSSAQIVLRNVDSGNTLYKFEVHDATGDLTEDASNYLTAATQFNGVPYAWKIITTSLASPSRPFRVPILETWNTTTTSQTLNVEFAQNSSATALTDQDIWSTLPYPNSASFPSSAIVTNRNADPITGSAANQTTSTAGWTGLTSPTKQKLASTFTAAAVGLLQDYVFVGVASKTVYINPGMTP